VQKAKTASLLLILSFIFSISTSTLCLAEEESAFFRGFDYLRNKQYTRAIRQFEITIKRNPTYLPTYSYLGECYERQNKYDKSKEVWKKYVEHAKFYKDAGKKHIELLDKMKEAKSILADVLREDVAEDTGIMPELSISDTSTKEIIDEKKAWEMAEPLLIDVVNDQYPMSIICLQAREILGKYYFKNKLYKEAVDAYKKVVTFYPRDITQEILYNYAISLGHIGEYEDSVKMFIQITENCPIIDLEKTKEFREQLMASYLGMANETAGTEEAEDMLKARKMYQKIEQHYSDTKAYETAHKNIMQVEELLAKRFEREGDEAYVEKDYSEAMKQYKKVMENCPTSSRYQNARKKYGTLQKTAREYANKAEESYINTKYSESLKYFNLLIEEFSGFRSDWAELRIGYIYANQKDYTKAVNQLLRMANKYPKSPYAENAIERAATYCWDKLDKRDNALKLYMYLVKHYPKGVLVDLTLYYIGCIRLQEKNYPKAYQAFKKILDDYPDSRKRRKARLQIEAIKRIISKQKKK